MRNIAIIPARSGSKGLKDKNIKELMGKPLLAYSIKAAEESQLFDKIMVSTDSEIYAKIAREYGAEVPFLRSEELSGDKVGSWDVVIDVLNRFAEMGEYYDTVCLLQPTSPLRDCQDVRNGYNYFKKKDAEAVTAVCEMDHSPIWSMVLSEDMSMQEYRQRSLEIPRQQLPTYYRVNGALYIRGIRYFKAKAELLSNREYAFIMNREKSIDIDTELDFKQAEFLMNYYNNMEG